MALWSVTHCVLKSWPEPYFWGHPINRFLQQFIHILFQFFHFHTILIQLNQKLEAQNLHTEQTMYAVTHSASDYQCRSPMQIEC